MDCHTQWCLRVVLLSYRILFRLFCLIFITNFRTSTIYYFCKQGNFKLYLSSLQPVVNSRFANVKRPPYFSKLLLSQIRGTYDSPYKTIWPIAFHIKSPGFGETQISFKGIRPLTKVIAMPICDEERRNLKQRTLKHWIVKA